MGSDLQPDGLTAGLAVHCQPDNKHSQSQKEEEVIFTSASRGTISYSQHWCCQSKSFFVTNV